MTVEVEALVSLPDAISGKLEAVREEDYRRGGLGILDERDREDGQFFAGICLVKLFCRRQLVEKAKCTQTHRAV